MELLFMFKSWDDFFESLLWLLICAPLALAIAGIWYLVKYSGGKQYLPDGAIKNLLINSFVIAFIIMFVLWIIIAILVD